MTTLADILSRFDTITFDCYGTLIDWHGGLLAAFGEMFGDRYDRLAGAAVEREDQLCNAYRRIEGEVQAEEFQSYRGVLAEVSGRLAVEIGVALPADGENIRASRLPTWPPFADTNAALTQLKKRFRLGVLSNIDRDLFAGTATHFDIQMDFVITAEDVGAYKPERNHFERAVSQYGQGNILHVAESLYHDGDPAGALGIAFVWINRYKVENLTQVLPLQEFADLKSLADIACPDR